jgi:hypothetical protein
MANRAFVGGNRYWTGETRLQCDGASCHDEARPPPLQPGRHSYTRRRAAAPDLDELPAVSGDECAHALLDLGWHYIGLTPTVWRLSREGQSLVIPRDPALDPHWLKALLDAVRLRGAAFVGALARTVL